MTGIIHNRRPDGLAIVKELIVGEALDAGASAVVYLSKILTLVRTAVVG